MEINKIQGFFRSISGNKNNTILRQMPCDSVSFSASKPVIKSEEERIKDFKDRNLSCVSGVELIEMPQEQYDKGLALIDKGLGCKQATQFAKYNDDRYQRLADLLDKNCPPKFAADIISNSYYDRAEKLLYDYPEFLEIIDSSYELEYEDYRDFSTGFQLVAKKTVDNDGEKVVKKVIMDHKGNISKNTSFYNADTIESSSFAGNKSTITVAGKIDNRYGTFENVSLQIEVVNDENGEPEHIVSTKRSDKLQGAYETRKYNLADYPEDWDMISLIKDGTLEDKIEEFGLKQGEKLSCVSESVNGDITYDENYTYNGKEITKKYIKKGDFANSYSYEIKNEDGSTLLKMDRSWQKNDDGTTTTIINGKEYLAEFDDENYKVKVTDSDGKQKIIKIGDSCLQGSEEPFFEFAKTVPADLLISLANMSVIEFNPKHSGLYLENYYLEVQPDQGALAHELGHGEDWLNQNIDYVGKINGNRNLIKIYNEEMEKFNKENPSAFQDVIAYFSRTGGSRSSGLSEVVADVKTLMTSYGHIDEE